MQPDLLASLRRLSDAELVTRVHDLAASERGATVALVAHLAELDTRDVHLRAGHGSLFAYCRDVLGLAELEAYNRIAVARAARRFPVVLELLENGSLHLTAVRLLGPHLTPANHQDVLEKARGKTKGQLEELAAALWPRPDAPSFVRKLPARPLPPPVSGAVAATGGVTSPAEASRSGLESGSGSPFAGDGRRAPAPWAETAWRSAEPLARPAAPGQDCPSPLRADAPAAPAPTLPPPASRRSAEVTALAPDRYKVQVTIGSETLEKLRLAKDLLRHAVPSGDEAVILDRALTALLAHLAHKRFAATQKPRPAGGTAPGSRRIPAEVRRAVWLRDRGCCAYVATSGRRCGERAFLEFHHVTPYALGGEATPANIQLRCRSHNAYEARLYFGNGNGGAGHVREEARRYPSAVAAAGRHAPGSRARSRTSRAPGVARGRAP